MLVFKMRPTYRNTSKLLDHVHPVPAPEGLDGVLRDAHRLASRRQLEHREPPGRTAARFTQTDVQEYRKIER